MSITGSTLSADSVRAYLKSRKDEETARQRAHAAELAMLGLEAFREAAAVLYINETGSAWRPATGSRLNHAKTLTSAVIASSSTGAARSAARTSSRI